MDINLNWELIIKLSIVSGFPWLLQSKKPTEFFRIEGIDFSVVFNFFASLFGSVLFACLYRKDNIMSGLSCWFYLSIICIFGYYWIQSKFYKQENDRNLKYLKEQLEKVDDKEKLDLRNKINLTYGRIVLQFILYIVAFCSLSICLVSSKLHV